MFRKRLLVLVLLVVFVITTLGCGAKVVKETVIVKETVVVVRREIVEKEVTKFVEKVEETAVELPAVPTEVPAIPTEVPLGVNLLSGGEHWRVAEGGFEVVDSCLELWPEAEVYQDVPISFSRGYALLMGFSQEGELYANIMGKGLVIAHCCCDSNSREDGWHTAVFVIPAGTDTLRFVLRSTTSGTRFCHMSLYLTRSFEEVQKAVTDITGL